MLRRLRALFRRDAITDEIREEFEFHLDMRVEEHMRQGWSREDAERLVRRRFGNVAAWRDKGYDQRGAGLLDSIRQDVMHGIRILRSRPAYSIAAIATLTLGTSLIAVLSSIVDAAWLRPLPLIQADRLGEVMLRLGPVDDEMRLNPSMADLVDLQTLSSVFAAAGSYHAFEERPVFDAGEPERVHALKATDGYFEALGAAPVLGRTFARDDFAPGAEAVVVLGHGFWRQRFGADPDIAGRRVTIDGTRVAVIGVAPADFHRSVHVWQPMSDHHRGTMRGTGATVVVRLREGVGWDEARRVLNAAVVQWRPDEHHGRPHGATLDPVYAAILEDTKSAMVLVATGMLGLILLVGVNVSGLVYADGASRRQDLAVRASLGAGRGRLVRQQLTEASVLALVASVTGLLVAYVSLDSVLAVLPLEIPPHLAPSVDVRTIGATLLTGTVVAWLVTAWPAWRMARLNLREWVNGRIPDAGRMGFVRPGQVGVAAQVALAVVLLAGGGLLVRSLDKLLSVDLGFEPDAVQVLEVVPLDPSPVVWADYYTALVDRLRSLPGVEAVGASDWIPLQPQLEVVAMSPDGGPNLSTAGVTPGALEALGVRVMAGRLLTSADRGQPVVVLSEAAREVFGQTDVVGRTVDVSGPQTVIGVVSDIRGDGPRWDPQPVVYAWLHPHAFFPPSVVIRTSTGGPTMEEMRAVATSLGPRVLVERLRPVTALLDENIQRPRQRTRLVTLLATAGLGLALVGVAGVTAQAVARRTREIAVRVAFGATPRQVVRVIAGDSLKPAIVGVTLGLIVATYSGYVLDRYLFEVTATDVPTLAAVAIVIVGASISAAWIPARHAARVDPVQALRQ